MTPKKVTGPGSNGRFRWKCANGKTITLPSLADLDPDMDVLERISEDLKSDNPLISLPANRRFLLSALPDADKEALANVKRMKEFGDLLDAWAEHSGVSVGESPAS